MRKPQQLGPKEVSHTPIILQCGPPKFYPMKLRQQDRARDIDEICQITHDGLVFVEIDGKKYCGQVPYVTSDGGQCFICTGSVNQWVPTAELQKWNCGLSLANVPGDGRLGVKGYIATIGAMIVSVMVMQGCDQGSRLVLPREHVPAVEK